MSGGGSSRTSRRLRAERNAASKLIGGAKDAEERQRLIEEQRAQSGRLDELEERAAQRRGRTRPAVASGTEPLPPRCPDRPRRGRGHRHRRRRRYGRGAASRCTAARGRRAATRARGAPEAALGDRRGARHHRLRARDEDRGLAVLPAARRRRSPSARTDRVDARPPPRAGLRRGLHALRCQGRHARGNGPAAEVRGDDVPSRG